MQVGVGTSKLAENMVLDGGYESVLNVDYSSVAIETMKEMHRAIPQLQYRISDCRSMPEIQSGAFDCLLDKGTLDAMLCGHGFGENSIKYLSECFR